MSETIILSDSIDSALSDELTGTSDYTSFDEAIIMSDCLRDSDMVPDTTRPMWEVYLNGTDKTGKLLHVTGVDDNDLFVLDAKLTLQVGEAGNFSFSITPNHALYNELTPYKTTVTIYQEGVELFRGRVTGYSTDIERQRQVECEGDLGYLNDVIFPNSEISLKERKLSDAFGYFIQLYNKFGQFGEDSDHYFLPGTVNIGKASYKIKMEDWLGTDKSETTFTDARSLIDEFIDSFGGYLRTKRHDDGRVYLEYISGYTDVGTQIIEYGSTLQELTIDTTPDDLFTVLIPLGDSVEEESVTIKSARKVASTNVRGATILHEKGSKWNNAELVWKEGVEKYGRIMRQESFTGITDPNELLTRASSYFRECIASHLGNFTLKAVDQHLMDPDVRPIYLGQKVRIISDPHGIDTSNQLLTCMKIDYDLLNPEATSYEFDIPFQPITNTFTSKYKEQTKGVEKEAEETKKKSKKAKKAADAAGDAVDEHASIFDDARDWMGKVADKLGIDLTGWFGTEDSAATVDSKSQVDHTEDVDGIKYGYNKEGRLISATDKDGKTVTFDPNDSVKDVIKKLKENVPTDNKKE